MYPIESSKKERKKEWEKERKTENRIKAKESERKSRILHVSEASELTRDFFYSASPNVDKNVEQRFWDEREKERKKERDKSWNETKRKDRESSAKA